MGQTEIPQEIVSARTSDGWELRVFHYLPEGKDVVRFPVILCHGLAANKNSCDFGESGTREWDRYSLAAFLSQQQPDGGPVFDPRKNPERYRWCVDDYIDKDVPAIIQCIQQ